jgi:hypothetical protein
VSTQLLDGADVMIRHQEMGREVVRREWHLAGLGMPEAKNRLPERTLNVPLIGEPYASRTDESVSTLQPASLARAFHEGKLGSGPPS